MIRSYLRNMRDLLRAPLAPANRADLWIALGLHGVALGAVALVGLIAYLVIR